MSLTPTGLARERGKRSGIQGRKGRGFRNRKGSTGAGRPRREKVSTTGLKSLGIKRSGELYQRRRKVLQEDTASGKRGIVIRGEPSNRSRTGTGGGSGEGGSFYLEGQSGARGLVLME